MSTGLKITKFLGIFPRIGAELLPDTAAQIAKNVRLESGNLVPYRNTALHEDVERNGGISALYVLRNPNTQAPVLLSWPTRVSVAIASFYDDDYQRFYYTGDGVPKVSNYPLATTGSKPYPVTAYDLGLPLPTAKPTTVASATTTSTTASFARDNANTATIVTGTAHGLRTGNTAIVSGFSFRTGTYSQSGTTITVTITGHGLSSGAQIYLFITSGDAISSPYTATVTGANTFTVVGLNSLTTSGNLGMDIRGFNLNGGEVTVINSTTFTFFSPGPAITTTASTAGTVNLGGNPQNRTYTYTWMTPWDEESVGAEPSDDLFIREGQTVTVSNLPSAAPAGNHQIRGIRLYRTLASASGTDFFLLRTLWFPNTTTTVSRTSNVSSVTMLYPHNLSEGDYFKLAGCTDSSFDITGGVVVNADDDYTFTYAQVDTDVGSTADATGTLTIDASQFPGTDTPIYWGDGGVYTFVDSYDSRYLFQSLQTDEYDAPPDELEGLVALQNEVLAGYVGNEVYFSEPARPHAWPRSYKVTIEHKIKGLAVAGGSLIVITDAYPYVVNVNDPAAGVSIQKIDFRYACVSEDSIAVVNGAVFWATHDGLASYSISGGPRLMTGMNFNDLEWKDTLDPTTIVAVGYRDKYVASHSTGGFIFQQDGENGGSFVTLDNTFTAAHYDSVTGKLFFAAGVDGEVYEWDKAGEANQTFTWKSKVLKTQNMVNIGAARVIADYPGILTFKFYVDKLLKATVTVTGNQIFRLPSGYRSDTFEVEVVGSIRVREVHIGETPTGLKRI